MGNTATDFRPDSWGSYLGQDDTKELLQMYISGSKLMGETLAHSLFLGPSGMGKTTLALIVAKAVGTQCHEVMATKINNTADIVNLLKVIKANDILFIDEIHMLSKELQTYMYEVMETGATVPVWNSNKCIYELKAIPPFTLIGATTHEGALNTAFLSRCTHKFRLQPYTLNELTVMGRNSASRKYGISVGDDILLHIARLSHGTARALNNLVSKVVVAAAGFGEALSIKLVDRVLRLESIDNMIGLDYSTRQYLVALSSQGGRAIGLKTLCSLCNQEPATIERVIEPMLSIDVEMFRFDVSRGSSVCGPLIESTSKGRVPTVLVSDYLRYCRHLQTQGWFKGEKLG